MENNFPDKFLKQETFLFWGRIRCFLPLKRENLYEQTWFYSEAKLRQKKMIWPMT